MLVAEHESKDLNTSVEDQELNSLIDFNPRGKDPKQVKKTVKKMQQVCAVLRDQKLSDRRQIQDLFIKLRAEEKKKLDARDDLAQEKLLRQRFSKPIIALYKPPHKFVDAADIAKVQSAITSDKPAREISLLLDRTMVGDKIKDFAVEMKSMMESLNSMKQLFGELKMIPISQVLVKDYDLNPRTIEIDDRFLDAFWTSFMNGPHAYLLDEIENMPPVGKRPKKKRRAGQHQDARLEAIYEVSEELKECWKYLCDTRYTASLKRQRKKEVKTLPTIKVKEIIGDLTEFGMSLNLDPEKELKRGEMACDKLMSKINTGIEEQYMMRYESLKKPPPATSSDLKAVKKPKKEEPPLDVKDFIDVKFATEGELLCFKLRPNLL